MANLTTRRTGFPATIPLDKSRGVKHPFPSDFVSPEVKISNEYGLYLAKAIYYSTMSYGPSLFYNDRQVYREYINYALGEQPEDYYKPLLRIDPKQPNEQWVGALRWAVKNYATKRVNIAVSKMSRREFDPIVDPIDASAVEQKLMIRNRIKTYMDQKQFFDEVGRELNMSFVPGEIDPALLPNTKDELDVWMETDFKFQDASIREKLIKHHMDRNRWQNIKRQIDFDIFVIGAGIAYVGMDSNLLPEVYRVNPADIIVPPTDREDFSDIGFNGHIMRPTIPEFKKMVGSSLPENVVEELVQRYGRVDPGSYYFRRFDRPQEGWQDQTRMEIMRFCYRTEDQLVRVKKRDKYGNTRLAQKDFNDFKTNREQKKFREKYGTDRKLYRPSYYTVLEGFWVVGSDQVFRYGPMHNQIRPRGMFSQSLLPYKIFAPNIKNNRTHSTIKDMIPVLDELQAYHIKKQHTIASAFPTGVSIDLNALRNAKFKWNDKNMTDQDKINFLFQTGVFLFDPGDRYLPGSSYKPIMEIKSTQLQEVTLYLNLIQQSLMELDEIIGINKVTAAGTLRADTLKGTAEVMEQNTEVALDYLYKADEEITLEVVKTMGILTDQSVKYREDDYYENIIGSNGLRAIKTAPFKDYGYNVQLRPTAKEWERLYAEALDALKAGQIMYDDYLDLRAISNLKEARQIFKSRVRKLREEAQNMEREKMQATIQGQQQSNVQAHENQVQLKNVEGEWELKLLDRQEQLEARKHQWTMQQLELKLRLQTEGEIQVQDKKGDEKVRELIVQDKLYETNMTKFGPQLREQPKGPAAGKSNGNVANKSK